jgi:hypothetical protein
VSSRRARKSRAPGVGWIEGLHKLHYSDPKSDAILKLDGYDVKVPQAAPKPRNIQSTFSQSEYLVYQESQVRMRYLLTIEF